MLHIQIVSDLHIEFWKSKKKNDFIKPTAPILALIGDIGCCGNDADFEDYTAFIDELLPRYKHVFVVSGNHEYYHYGRNPKKITEIDKRINTYCLSRKNLTYLNNKTAQLKVGKKTYLIVGSTLWSYIPNEVGKKVEKVMSDYKYIYTTGENSPRKISYLDIQKMHIANVKFIKSQITRAKKSGFSVVILTHHKPYIDKKHTGTYDFLNYAYMSDLLFLIEEPVVLWAYGHTHVAENRLINGVRLYSCPKGYPHERTGYNKAASIKV